MEKFIKQNWFKLFLALVVTFLCVFLAYYLFIFLPHEKKLTEEKQILAYNQEQNQKCASASSTFFKNFKQESDNLSRSTGLAPNYFEDPKYHFNTNLKTCLIEISYTIFWMSKDGVSVSLIEDVYSNKLVITSTWSPNGTLNRNLPYEDYKKQAENLMSE